MYITKQAREYVRCRKRTSSMKDEEKRERAEEKEASSLSIIRLLIHYQVTSKRDTSLTSVHIQTLKTSTLLSKFTSRNVLRSRYPKEPLREEEDGITAECPSRHTR